jgi:hypothetical protein
MNLSRSAPLIDSFPSFQHLNNITNFPKALADAGRHWGLTLSVWWMRLLIQLEKRSGEFRREQKVLSRMGREES